MSDTPVSARCACPPNGRFFALDDIADDTARQLAGIRQHIHAHPELGYEEFETSDYVASLLQEWGYALTRGIGGTGLVATLKCGTGSRSIMIRADMDALPIHETTGLPYQSRHAGKMHACGHDGHTAMVLGAAQALAQTRRFDGTVHLVFQPAEEVGVDSGAARMIADGLFDRFPCDAIFGIHNHPGVASGTFGFRPGALMAAGDLVRVTVHGRGGHAARPHQSIDPIVVISSMIMALQTIVARNVPPTETAVVTVGTLHAGHVANVIPNTATMELSVRSFDEKIRTLLETRIRELLEAQAASYGASVEVDYQRGYPVVVNSPDETALACAVAEELVGAENVISPFPQITGSEDFAFYLQHRPGCFIRLGNGTDNALLHNSAYDFNDANLAIGAAFWTRLAERFLNTASALPSPSNKD